MFTKQTYDWKNKHTLNKSTKTEINVWMHQVLTVREESYSSLNKIIWDNERLSGLAEDKT